MSASEAGAAFIGCGDPSGIRDLDEIGPLVHAYDFHDGLEGRGFYRRLDVPPPADPIEAARLILREAASEAAGRVKISQ